MGIRNERTKVKPLVGREKSEMGRNNRGGRGRGGLSKGGSDCMSCRHGAVDISYWNIVASKEIAKFCCNLP